MKTRGAVTKTSGSGSGLDVRSTELGRWLERISRGRQKREQEE